VHWMVLPLFEDAAHARVCGGGGGVFLKKKKNK
jgi:hypothetical protein